MTDIDFGAIVATALRQPRLKPQDRPTISRSLNAAPNELRPVVVALEGVARSRAADLSGTVGPPSRGYKSGSSFLGDKEPEWVSRCREEIEARKRQQSTPKRKKPVVPDLQVDFDPLVRASSRSGHELDLFEAQMVTALRDKRGDHGLLVASCAREHRRLSKTLVRWSSASSSYAGFQKRQSGEPISWIIGSVMRPTPAGPRGTIKRG